MNVVDAHGRPLHEGDFVKTGILVGTYLKWEDWGYDPAISGELTGQVVVEIEERECRYPTFRAVDSHACFDVERIRT